MPRIAYPDPATRSEVQRRSTEHPLNISKMTAYMPDRLLTTMGQFGRAVLNNPDLDEHLREMVILRTHAGLPVLSCEIRTSWRSARYSAARVGPKSA